MQLALQAVPCGGTAWARRARCCRRVKGGARAPLPTLGVISFVGASSGPQNAQRFWGCPACLAPFRQTSTWKQGDACVAPTKVPCGLPLACGRLGARLCCGNALVASGSSAQSLINFARFPEEYSGGLCIVRSEPQSPVRYVSTRGEAPSLGFVDAMLAGLARDGGLYVPAAVAAASTPMRSPALPAGPMPRSRSR